jgi:hypothetical protein
VNLIPICCFNIHKQLRILLCLAIVKEGPTLPPRAALAVVN